MEMIGDWVASSIRTSKSCVLSGEDRFDEATTIDREEPPVLAEHPLAGHPTAQSIK